MKKYFDIHHYNHQNTRQFFYLLPLVLQNIFIFSLCSFLKSNTVIIRMNFFTADTSFFIMRGHYFSACMNSTTIGINFLIAWVGFFTIDGRFFIIVWTFLHQRFGFLHQRYEFLHNRFAVSLQFIRDAQKFEQSLNVIL